jgi:hypothetical protein
MSDTTRLSNRITLINPGFMEKKAQLRGVALNPPKEEGGGDKLEH